MAIVKFAKDNLTFKIGDRRIQRIEYVHDKKSEYAEVGQPYDYGDRPGELVIAILEGNIYLVCTPNRGVLRGIPYLVGTEEVYRAVPFDPPEGRSPSSTDR